MKIIFKSLTIFVFAFLFSIGSYAQQNFDAARIYKAMNKGRNGQDIQIGVLGGSITQGYAASSDAKRWSNLMADWWETTFPDSKVELINAGWGGTGSDIGAHRAYDDLLVDQPDFMMLEFSVNDAEGELAKKMMEGLVQQSLLAENTPGLILLILKQDDGTTAQASHKPVAEHYKVPYVSFADLIDAKLAEDGVELSSIFADGLHPNDAGMAYIAGFIHDMLDSIYSTLPAEDQLPMISTELPEPLVTDIYSKSFQFFPNNIVPTSNQGWEMSDAGWSSEVAGQQIDFEVQGNAVSVIFTQNNGGNRGRAHVWVDDSDKTIIDAYMTDDWGTKYAYALVQEGLSNGKHALHIKVINESSTSGHLVNIERIMVAGNVGSAAPIAKTSPFQKGVVDYKIEFDGSESFDPDGDNIDQYDWSIVKKPEGSAANIDNANEVNANFTPDVAGDYFIGFKVTASEMESVPAMKKVSVRASNAKPIAVPGNDTISALDKFFRFDGTNSYDDDGDALTYRWEIESKPESSITQLMLPETEKPQCKFDMVGDYLVSLVVFDSLEYSDKIFVTVEGRDGYTSIKAIESNFGWVKVYPNPVSIELSVEYFMENPEPVNVKLLSLDGKVVMQFNQQTNQRGMNIINVDIKDLSVKSGVYLLNLSDSSKSKTIRTTII